jgi:hypothetical protein
MAQPVASPGRRTSPPSPTAITLGGVLTLLICTVALVGGCSRRPVAVGPAIPVPAEDADRLLADLAGSARGVQRYQAVLKVRGEGPDGRFSATEVLIFQRPDRVRVELLATFGPSRWIAVTRDGRITVLFPKTREYLEESAVEDVVAALLGIRLSPPEVMAILDGSGLPLAGERSLRAERRGDRIRIALPSGTVDVEADQVREAQAAGYRVIYPTEWKDMQRQVPDRIDIVSEKLEASLSVEDLDINVRLDPEAFVVSLPDGAGRLALAQIEGEAVFVRPSQ